ncbi:MAG TPA: hypothetical protein VGE28_10530 [Pseudomonas sp.]
MPTFVYNLDGTSNRKCQCTDLPRTWLGHWARGTGETLPVTCVAHRCGNAATVGAHVRDEEDQRIVWIVPFCQKHNKRPSSTPIQLKPGISMCGGSMTGDCE